MNKRTQRKIEDQRRQLELSWESFEWLIKDRLIKIDEITRHMIREMQLCGVPKDMIAEELPKLFEKLKREVVEENNLRFKERDFGSRRAANG